MYSFNAVDCIIEQKRSFVASVFCKLGIFCAMCSLLVGPLSFGMGTGAAMFQSSLATLEFISQLHFRILGQLCDGWWTKGVFLLSACRATEEQARLSEAI